MHNFLLCGRNGDHAAERKQNRQKRRSTKLTYKTADAIRLYLNSIAVLVIHHKFIAS